MNRSPAPASVDDLTIFWEHHVPFLLRQGRDSTLRGIDAVAVLELDGDPDRAWTIRVVDGRIESVEAGASAESTTRIRIGADEFLRIARGESDHREAFFAGRVHVEGDVETVLRAAELIPILRERFPFDPETYRRTR